MGTGVERTLRTEELSGDVEGFTSHNDDLLAFEELLSHGAGKATEQVTLAINNDLFKKPTVSLCYPTRKYIAAFPMTPFTVDASRTDAALSSGK